MAATICDLPIDKLWDAGFLNAPPIRNLSAFVTLTFDLLP